MKLRLCSLFLIGLLLTGCGKDTVDNLVEMTSVVQIESTKAVFEEESLEITSEETEESETEVEPYILNFTATTVDGEELTSSCFSNSKLTMINVWATYCNPCLSEMPDLGEIAADYDSAEFQIIGVVSDVAEGSNEETIANVKDLITQTNANYPHLLLSESLYTNLVGMVDSVPTTFFVNEKGEPLGYVIGARSKESWEEIINELLAEIE
ncbi:MAG: TlpA family protein disulfide reductase [Lachnospiraceae bacterium]|nr:TlpA family protein disulfide reductase [Lachnospiraceae bacterium]